MRTILPGAQLVWAGSQRKGTAIEGSDLDVAMMTSAPVREAQRRALRDAIEARLRRPVRIGSHAIRISADLERLGLDPSFLNAAFNSREAVDPGPWTAQPKRQQAARALKIWLRSGGHPAVSGWAIEALVLHLDSHRSPTGLALLRRIVDWLANTAKPADVEAILRPKAHPAWNPAWSAKLPGRLEALRNGARALSQRRDGPDTWKTTDDVQTWLRGRR